MTDNDYGFGLGFGWACDTNIDIPVVTAPQTDEEVKVLVGEETMGQVAMYGIYSIYRKQGESVEEAYQHLMNDLLALLESKKRPGVPATNNPLHSDGTCGLCKKPICSRRGVVPYGEGWCSCHGRVMGVGDKARGI